MGCRIWQESAYTCTLEVKSGGFDTQGKALSPRKGRTVKPSEGYEASQGYRLVKAKIGAKLAKVAYDEVLKHQRTGSTITLTMWYTLVNHRENAKWNFRAKNHNLNGTWDCGLGQVNMKRCTTQAFNPEWAIKKSISILAHKNLHFANKDTRLTFKRYNGDGARATEYARVCMKYYNQYMKGA